MAADGDDDVVDEEQDEGMDNTNATTNTNTAAAAAATDDDHPHWKRTACCLTSIVSNAFSRHVGQVVATEGGGDCHCGRRVVHGVHVQ